MAPLVNDLTTSGGERPDDIIAPELSRVEVVPAAQRLGVDGGKVRVDRPNRVGRCPKAKQLGMASVTASSAPEYSPRKQGLPPQGHKTLRIEVFGMNGPETHVVALKEAI